jgi:hypothetical protein
MAPAPAEQVAAVAVAAAPLDLAAVKGAWEGVLRLLGERHSLMATCFQGCAPVGLADGMLTLAFSESAGFLQRKASSPEYSSALREVLAELLGSAPRLAFETRSAAEVHPDAEPPLAGEALVSRLMAEFDAEEVVPEPEEPQA